MVNLKPFVQYTENEPIILESRLHPIKSDEHSPPLKNARYVQLIRTLFNPEANTHEGFRTLALAAISPGSGTSLVAAGLGAELTFHLGNSTVVADAVDLRYLGRLDPDGIMRSCQKSRVPNLWRLNRPDQQAPPAQDEQEGCQAPVLRQATTFFPEFLEACIQALSGAFDYVLLDCPALSVSHEVLILAPWVDGIVLVVEAGRTTTGQVNQARKMIEMSGGKVLGYVLNKYKDPLPDSIAKRL
jgi:hypothetical protein